MYVAKPSIQEFAVSGSLDDPSGQYFDWVDEYVPGVSVQRDEMDVHMHVLGFGTPAISLRRRAKLVDADTYDVVGGLFVSEPPGGRFTFEVPSAQRLRILLEGFTPRLPKLFYLITHALVHEYVMWSFQRFMEVPKLEEVS